MLPTLFHIGPLTLRTYGLLIAMGFIVGLAVLRRTARPLGIIGDDVERLAVLMLITGILGARLMYYAVDGFRGLAQNPLSFFKIWAGGLAFYGGVLAAGLAAIFYSRRRKIRLLSLADALVPPLFIAHAFGRIGCLAAGCCYGRPADGWPGITFTHPESLAPLNVPLVPVQPLESLVLATFFVISYQLYRRSPHTGVVSAFYLCSYAVARFFLEYLRGDDRGMSFLGLSPSQVVAVALFATGVAVYLYGQRKAAD
jgi:phosphatidylglycerol:prolipoprotein diacylglycerol transferase